MSNTFILIILAVLSYFLGNLNFAILIAKSKNKDIRKMGSGNPGTLNVSRNLGLKTGLLTFFLDIVKGALPTLVSYFILKGRVFENTSFNVAFFGMFLCGFCVVLGHIYPVLLKFKGGKGIASSIGVFLVCECVQGWQWALVIVMALIAAALFIYFTEFGAMGSFIAITPPAIASAIFLFLTYSKFKDATIIYYIFTNLFIFAICFFTWFAHRKNIKQMLAGDEHPTSIRIMIAKMKSKKNTK